jgi:predicted MFS family arabinose efflux permease
VTEKGPSRRTAFRFVLTIGIVNLFADMTYEGARSITGPFLESLGASALAVGIVAGGGELLGYTLRSVAGYFADKTQRYWLIVIAGYVLNMIAVPALALAGNWPLAAALIVAERTGRGIRKPVVDTMVSYAGKSIGSGWVFGLNESLDQAGATLGPLIVAFVLYARGGFHEGFAVLLISALLCLGTLVAARFLYPHPDELEEKPVQTLETRGFSKAYWLYVAGGALLAAGFADFALIAFHFNKTAVISETEIPLVYAIAMAAAALTSLGLGRLFDRIGLPVAAIAFFLGAMFALFVFRQRFSLIVIGMLLWGIGMGAQSSLLKALLTAVMPVAKRSTGFGLFYTAFGIAWFIGSAVMGFLYDKSILGLIVFSIFFQLAALPVFSWANAEARRSA